MPERKSRVMPSIRGKFTESINGGVFKRAIEKADEVKLLLNHNKKRELGSTKSNLTIKEDEIGLYAKATIVDDEVRQLAIDKKLTGWSFGFRVNKDKWSQSDNDIQHRTIEDLDLLEISVLSITPAYYATLTGWSFGFRVNKDKWSQSDNDIQHRTIEDLDLLEISVLSITPAYYATKVESRELENSLIENRSIDNIYIDIKEDNEKDDESEEENRLFLCHKHKVDTLLRLKRGGI